MRIPFETFDIRRDSWLRGAHTAWRFLSFIGSNGAGKPSASQRQPRARSGECPIAVKRAIWAANQLRTKPYRFGGGHRSFHDSGYDCFWHGLLRAGRAGLVRHPDESKGFRGYGHRGRGKWITIYARNGHSFAVIGVCGWIRLRWIIVRGAGRLVATDRSDAAGFDARHPSVCSLLLASSPLPFPLLSIREKTVAQASCLWGQAVLPVHHPQNATGWKLLAPQARCRATTRGLGSGRVWKTAGSRAAPF